MKIIMVADFSAILEPAPDLKVSTKQLQALGSCSAPRVHRMEGHGPRGGKLGVGRCSRTQRRAPQMGVTEDRARHGKDCKLPLKT